MPRGGRIVVVDTQQRGLTGFMYGFLQYVHEEYVQVVMRTRPLGEETASSVGRILRLAWLNGTAAICEHLYNDSQRTIFTQPACPPPRDAGARESAVDVHGVPRGCACVPSYQTRKVPARSQHARPRLPYAMPPETILSAWARAVEIDE